MYLPTTYIIYYILQLLSMSVAKGIEFYKSKKFACFTDSEETIKFTVMMNNMFDALNRKYPAEGIKQNSRDLEVFKCCVFVLLTCRAYN